MFAGWGSWVARFRWPVLSVALVAVIGAGIWGLGVFGQLTEGGYNDPNSESTRASQTVQDAFGARGGDLVVIYTPANGKIDDPALGKRIRERLAALPKSAVTKSTSYWNQKSSQYVAKDKSSAIAVITLAGDGDDAKLDAYREIGDKFAVDGATAQLSGAVALADASSARSTSDLGAAELISLPITLILLVFLFGSLVAASLPVLVGGAAVLGSLGVLHLIASFHEVNSFAVNVASLLGLGMAIDYGLFMVGRFREEQAAGRTPAEAVSRTVGTAGRTVVFSATLLMIALAGLLLFPQGYLNSLAYGGLAAVFFAAVLSLTLLPALLAALGKRVDKLPVHLPRRAKPNPVSGWTRLAGFVLRRPLIVAVPILAALVLLASPIHSVKFGDSDERTLPASDPARQAIETLKADYPQFSGNGVQIVLRGGSDTSAFAVAARQIPGIAQLSTAERADGVTLFTATLRNSDPYSAEARDIVSAIRGLPVPRGAELLVGGTTARNVDSLEATADRLPLMIVLLVGATLLLMFLAFGSILLPIKAVMVSALSLSATFGVLVWIFQQGHGSDLLNVTPAPLEVGIVVLMAAVVFGLSTDYEVFLLSRMVEARTRGASTAEAVTTGLTRTGRVISAAAALLIVVTGAFGLSSVTTMRFVGVGMIVALVLDATIVRMLLVPAVLGLLGDAAWWAPGPLRRLQQRARLSEYAGEQTAPAAALTGRHSAPDDRAARTGLVGRRAALALPAAPVADDPAEALALPAAAVPLALPAGPGDVTEVIPRIRDEEPSEMSGGKPGEDDSDLPAFGRAVADRPGLYSGAGATPVEAAGYTTDWSAPDEFFFAPSGKAIELPAAEPPKPWERPALPAVPLPAVARDDTGRDVSNFESTRDLTAAARRSTDPETIRMVAPDLDVTGRMEAADVEATGVIPAPQAAPETVSGPTAAEAPRPATLAETPQPTSAEAGRWASPEALRPTTPADPPRPGAPAEALKPAPPVDAPRPTTPIPAQSFERTFEAPSAEPAMADLEERLNRIFDRPAAEPIAPVPPLPPKNQPASSAPAASAPTAPAAPEQALPASAATPFTAPVAPTQPAATRPVTTPPPLAPAAATPMPAAPAQVVPAAAAETPPVAEPVLSEPVGRAPGIAAPYVSAHVSAPTRPAGDPTPTFGAFAPTFDSPADHHQASGLSQRLSNLSGGFRRADLNEIPAQRRPSNLSDLQQRPADLAALQNADRGIPGWGRSGDDEPRRRPATLADQPPLPSKPAGELETELTHRPADLRDHLRATRPADLGQYTHSQKPEPTRRPATLADRIPEQRHAPDDEVR